MELHPLIYNKLIDPLMQGSRTRIINRLNGSEKVIDIASGTGQLAREMSDVIPEVAGIDLEERMVSFARNVQPKNSTGNISFYTADARKLDQFADHSFNLATMSLALHQFSSADWYIILDEVFRITDRLLILDYSYPLPGGFKKTVVKIAERIAGKEHFQNFTAFMDEGGVIPIIESKGLSCSHFEISGSGIFSLYEIV